MQRRVMWVLITVLSLATYVLPIWLGLVAIIPIVFFSWWVAYRSGWID